VPSGLRDLLDMRGLLDPRDLPKPCEPALQPGPSLVMGSILSAVLAFLNLV
jgi:hypothetical protein